jgi:hypothetical protein
VVPIGVKKELKSGFSHRVELSHLRRLTNKTSGGKMKGVFAPRIAGTVLLALVASFAQNNSPGAVRWTEGAANATSEVKNDAKIEGLKTDDVHIYVSLADLQETEYNRVWVQVSNPGKSPVDFDPQGAVLLNGDKSVRADVPDKAAKSVQRFGEAKSQELSSAHCTLMGSTTCQPTNAQMQMSKQVLAFSGQQAQWIRDHAMKAKTIAPGEEEQGVIVFKKDKKSANYILRIPVGVQVFEFPLSAQNKAPSYD